MVKSLKLLLCLVEIASVKEGTKTLKHTTLERVCKRSSIAMLLWAKLFTAIYQYKQTVPPPYMLLEGKVCNLLIDCIPSPSVNE